MTRPLRILFHTATFISLALCIFFAVLWVRSYFIPEVVEYRRLPAPSGVEIWSIVSYHGRFGIDGVGGSFDPLRPPQLGWSWRSGAGFFLRPGFDPNATIPHWHLLIYFGALPAWWCVRRYGALRALENRRRKRGLCPTCGYDIRATPERCPECGAISNQAIT